MNTRSDIRHDGVGPAGLYLVLLLVVPARLVLAKIPLSVTPAVVIASGLGVLWLCGHMVDSLNFAKGRSLARTSLVILLCAYLLTYGIATNRFLPSVEVNLADDGMIRILACVGMALFICDGVRGSRRIDALLKILIVATTVSAGVGLLQFVHIDLIPYLTVPGLRPVSDNSYVLGRSSFLRPAGTTNHPIEFGLVCAIVVPIAVNYLLRARDRGESWGRWLACLILIVAAAVISLSRTAIIGLMITGIILLICLPGRRKVMTIVAGGAFIGAGGVLVPGLLGTIFNLFSNIEDDSSITTRTQDYVQAFQQVDKHPFVGRGFGTYLPYKYQLLDNQYLLTMIENGYLGLTVMIGICVVGCYAVIRARLLTDDKEVQLLAMCLLSSILVIAIGMATFDLLSFGVATGLLFFLVGLAGALLRSVRQQRDIPPITVRFAALRRLALR